MKIRCTKEEHAELVVSCHTTGSCYGCVLENVCKMCEQEKGKESYQRLTELVEIMEDDDPPNRWIQFYTNSLLQDWKERIAIEAAKSEEAMP